jgi:hypothetical protein
MIGGRGWVNNGFLDSLGGSDEDQEEEKARYLEEQESRRAFNQRQEERMRSPAAQKFLEEYRNQQEKGVGGVEGTIMGGGSAAFHDNPLVGDEVSESSSGGTRFQGMMAKAKQQQEMRMRGGAPGWEQKLAIPLDENIDAGSDLTKTDTNVSADE